MQCKTDLHLMTGSQNVSRFSTTVVTRKYHNRPAQTLVSCCCRLHTRGTCKAPWHADAAKNTPRQILHRGAVNVDGRATPVKAHELIPALGPHPPVVARLLALRKSQTLVRHVPATTAETTARSRIRRWQRAVSTLYSKYVQGGVQPKHRNGW